MKRSWLISIGAVLALSSLGMAQTAVTPERLIHASREPQNWLTYFSDYSGVRHRTLNQINPTNVSKLRTEWIFQLPTQGRFETVPLVVDGIMYFTAQGGWTFALDAGTGRELWRYHDTVPEGVPPGGINRGAAVLNDAVYVVTTDARLLCLDARTGKRRWSVEIDSWKKGYGATLAPLAVKDKIIVGVSGGEFGIRGFIDAFNAKTGERAWRFWTVPAAGEPGGETWQADSWQRGGGPTWMTGTYDPELNLVYWGVGNPGPDLYGGNRLGDNLYTCSVVALDLDTGKLKWHYQFSPHDTHDWDANETPMLVDLPWQGKPRKLMLHANRNGFFYVLDRTTGEFLLGKAFARQTWLKEFNAKGRPIANPNSEASPEGTHICPGLAGGANFMLPSYNPDLKLFYVPYREQCDVYFSTPPKFEQGKVFWGTAVRAAADDEESGPVKAIDPLTGEARWTFSFHRAGWGGTVSTSGGLIFTGDEDGAVAALDARTGRVLWHFNSGAPIATSPMTYAVHGRQYVTMPSGAALLTFALPETPAASSPARPTANKK